MANIRRRGVWKMEFQNLDQLQAQIDRLVSAVTDEGAREALREAMVMIRERIRANVPESRTLPFTSIRKPRSTEARRVTFGASTNYMTGRDEKGRLKQAILGWVSKPGRFGRAIGSRVNAYVKVNYSWKAAVTAPHAHLVEFGAQQRKPKSGKYLRFPSPDGRWIYARQARALPARPFFRPAVASAGPQAMELAIARLGRVVEEQARKR